MIIDQILNISSNDLNKMDTTFINHYGLTHETAHFHSVAGREHYRLLMYISTLFENVTLFDVGTNRCMSAVALSYNQKNKIKSYDIVQLLAVNPIIDNVKFILGNSIEDDEIKSCPFIFLDVDHDGTYEKILYEHLTSINWKGILMLDDIHLNEPMKSYWNSFTQPKFDLTEKGHWSGTGLVYFE